MNEAQRGPSFTPVRAKAAAAWVRAVPFFLSGFLFMSGIFSIFAPLPLLLLFLQAGRRWAWAAALTNAILVLAIGGGTSLALFLVFTLAVALALPEFLVPGRKLDRAAGFTLLAVVVTAVAVVLLHSAGMRASPVAEIKLHAAQLVDLFMATLSPEVRSGWLAGQDVEEWKISVMNELPSGAAIFALLVVWANTVFLVRLNPANLRERLGLAPDYFRKWKAPEILLWPTIVCGFLLIIGAGWPSEVAANLFRFFMALYAIQGLSILNSVFEAWNIRGAIRTLAFLIAVFLMLPLVLSLGFFDLWFDFRAKLRQS